jgi:hypothetical protein
MAWEFHCSWNHRSSEPHRGWNRSALAFPSLRVAVCVRRCPVGLSMLSWHAEQPRMGGNSSPECATGQNFLLSMVGLLARTILGKNHSPRPAFIPIACSPIEFGFRARNPETSSVGVWPCRGGICVVVWFAQGRRKRWLSLIQWCAATIRPRVPLRVF